MYSLMDWKKVIEELNNFDRGSKNLNCNPEFPYKNLSVALNHFKKNFSLNCASKGVKRFVAYFRIFPHLSKSFEVETYDLK